MYPDHVQVYSRCASARARAFGTAPFPPLERKRLSSDVMLIRCTHGFYGHMTLAHSRVPGRATVRRAFSWQTYFDRSRVAERKSQHAHARALSIRTGFATFYNPRSFALIYICVTEDARGQNARIRVVTSPTTLRRYTIYYIVYVETVKSSLTHNYRRTQGCISPYITLFPCRLRAPVVVVERAPPHFCHPRST